MGKYKVVSKSSLSVEEAANEYLIKKLSVILNYILNRNVNKLLIMIDLNKLEERFKTLFEQETEDSFKKWLFDSKGINLDNFLAERCKNNFIAGASWQKEQDKNLIRELLVILSSTDNELRKLSGRLNIQSDEYMVKNIYPSAITKAENYLKH